ncbi:MAG: serine/threonine protein kinase [Deltaproteobacteria bacterium]|nr:serine/threonine protein kinase [Deltaproteobacteria bacterium]
MDRKNREVVAVKELRHKWVNSHRMVNYFENEFRSLERLSHESTIRPIKLLKENGSYLIVMEYLRGGSLADRLRRLFLLDIDTALSITVKILNVLDVSNVLRIIHRDIKPSNILFTDETFEHPKLGDFGLAFLSADLLPGSDSGDVAGVVGTAAYMSPEQLNGANVGIRSDIYSLGITLYKMLTGRLFFAADMLGENAIRRTICHPFRERPRHYRSNLPAWLDELVMSMIAFDPNDRPLNPGRILEVIGRKWAKYGNNR